MSNHIQQVTIKEYFHLMKKAQKVTPLHRLEFAKDYVRNRLKLEQDGLRIVSILKQLSVEAGKPLREFVAETALKELYLRIEEDLMGCVAELGVSTYLAVSQDNESRKKERQNFVVMGFGSYGRCDDSKTELHSLIDLEIVPTTHRPLVQFDYDNPFEDAPEEVEKQNNSPFKSEATIKLERLLNLRNLPFIAQQEKDTIIKELKSLDWDQLSETEWRQAKELSDKVTDELFREEYEKEGLAQWNKLLSDYEEEKRQRQYNVALNSYEDNAPHAKDLPDANVKWPDWVTD